MYQPLFNAFFTQESEDSQANLPYLFCKPACTIFP